MQTYPPWQAIYLSFFSKDLYQQVATKWKGFAFQYLVGMIFIAWLIIAGGLYLIIDTQLHGPLGDIINKLPAIKVKDGTMIIDKPSPYLVELKQGSTSVPVAVFDVTTDEPKPDTQAPFLLCKHSFFLGSGAQASQFEWKQFEGIDYNQSTYKSVADGVKTYLPIGLFVLGVPIWFIGLALQSFIYGAVGLAIAGMSNIKLTYAELVRLAVVAMTPGMIIEPLIKMAIPLVVPGSREVLNMLPFGLLTTIGFFCFGIMANKSAPQAMPPTV